MPNLRPNEAEGQGEGVGWVLGRVRCWRHKQERTKSSARGRTDRKQKTVPQRAEGRVSGTGGRGRQSREMPE